MSEEVEDRLHRVIARLRSPYSEKFGAPRQSGLVPSAQGQVVFEREFRAPDALRGIEDFSHLWLVFEFHQARSADWKPTVRPPRLGGNQRVGVFATRSPFRPNGIGLSVVQLDGVDWESPEGPVLRVSGLDMIDGTPIFDIKPYLPYADAVAGAEAGFAPESPPIALEVSCAEACAERWASLPEQDRRFITESLSLDPRPAFHRTERIYRLSLAGYELACRIEGTRCEVTELSGCAQD